MTAPGFLQKTNDEEEFTLTSKRKQREELAADVEAFLANGGEIQEIGTEESIHLLLNHYKGSLNEIFNDTAIRSQLGVREKE